MLNKPIHYSLCQQPTALDEPQIAFPSSGIDDATLPDQVAVESLLNANIQPTVIAAIAILVCFIAYILLARKFTSLFYLMVPAILITLITLVHMIGFGLAPTWVAYMLEKQKYAATLQKLVKANHAIRYVEHRIKLPRFAESRLNQYQQRVHMLADYVYTYGIRKTLTNNQLEQAQKLEHFDAAILAAKNVDRFRSYVAWATAQDAYAKSNYPAMLENIKHARAYWLTPATENLRLSGHALAFIYYAGKDTSKMLSHLEQVPREWRPELQIPLLDYAARQTLILNWSNKSAPDLSSLNELISVYGKISRRHIFIDQPHTSLVLTCDLAGLYNQRASYALQKDTPKDAIRDFGYAEELLKEGPYTKKMLPIALTAYGFKSLEGNNNKDAKDAFQQAYDRHPSKNYACNLALSLDAISFDEARRHRFGAAFFNLFDARKLCPEQPQNSYTESVIWFSHGEYYMQKGRFRSARAAFSAAIKNKDLNGINELSKRHLHSIPRLQHLLQKVNQGSSLHRMPWSSGILCGRENKFCDRLVFYANGESIGISNADLSQIYFDDRQYTSVFYGDANHDGYYEHVGYIKNGRETSYFDYDRDGSPDWLRVVAGSVLVKDKPLSGRIGIRISAAVGVATDFFSASDIYLLAYKNGYYVGRSETQNNTNYPSFDTEFVFDYRYRDKLEFVAMDEDIWKDDFVDRLIIKSLPESGYYRAKNNKIVFALQVYPSDKPEGVYPTLRSERQLNPFLAPSWLTETTSIASIVKRANREQARAQATASLTSLILPELVIAVTLRNPSLFQYLIYGFGGYELTNDLLTRQN